MSKTDIEHAPRSYEKPSVVDYGSLVELTAANGQIEAEDGIGKTINQDGSNGFIP